MAQIDPEQSSVFDNPHFWLASYGVTSHYFVWALSHGALDDIDPPGTRNRRLYRSRGPNYSDVIGTKALRALPTRVRLAKGYQLR